MSLPNNDPIYSRSGAVTFDGMKGMAGAILTAANDYTGIGPLNLLVMTADPSNGGYIQRLRFKPLGTNTASVARIFINNGLPPGQSILAPGAPTGTPSASGGFLATLATYRAQLAARDAYGGWSPAGTESSAQNVTGPTGSIAYTWSAVTNAVEYRLYVGGAAAAEYDYYTLSNCPNVWGYTTGVGSTTGGTIAAGDNYVMAEVTTTTGKWLLPSISPITTTGSTSSITWTVPIITGQGQILSYDFWMNTTQPVPGAASQRHLAATQQSNTFVQTLPASSYTSATATSILAFTQTMPGAFYQSGLPSFATNNSFYGEISLPGTTLSSSAALVDIDYPMNYALEPGHRVFVGLGTTVAAGWTVTPIGGKY